MSFEFDAVLSEIDGPLWYTYVPVPAEVSKELKAKGISRLICTVSGKIEKHCALMPMGDSSDFVLINKEERKKLNLEIGEPVHITLTEDKSKYGMHLPEEFEELLSQDPDGEAYFEGLTPGLKRSLLYIIGKPKRSETRIKKGIVILEYLKASGGKVDFKQINEAYRNSRL